jgi:hypothetical protein
MRLSKLLCFLILFAALLGVSPLYAQQLYSSTYATWSIENSDPVTYSYYQQYKINCEKIFAEMDKAIPAVEARLGSKLPTPVICYIVNDPGLLGWAGGGHVGYGYGCFKDASSMSWLQGVLCGEMCNNCTGLVTAGWPRNWWADDVWYFPGFVAIDVMKEIIDTATAVAWMTSERYPTYPVFNIYMALLKEFGWPVFQNLMHMITADKMVLGNVGANPSKILTDYTIAYISIAAGRNMANDWKNAKITDADSIEVAAIMKARNLLVLGTAQGKATGPAWTAFLSGNYSSALTLLNGLNIVAVRPEISMPDNIVSQFNPNMMAVHSLDGKVIYSGAIKPLSDIMPVRGAPGQAVIITYKLNNIIVGAKKVMLGR